jgi:hypothetical protein
MTLPPRFVLKVSLSGDCWVWQDNLSNKGYGRYAGKYVHRLMYGHLIGPLDPAKELHHTCKNPPCCNPDHLVELTRAEHQAVTPTNHMNRTSCPKGHPYSPENTRIELRADGGEARRCLACERARGTSRRKLPPGESNFDRAQQNLCKAGHDLANAYIKPNGTRACRTCTARRMREYRARDRQSAH